jgi:hypothetical protein
VEDCSCSACWVVLATCCCIGTFFCCCSCSCPSVLRARSCSCCCCMMYVWSASDLSCLPISAIRFSSALYLHHRPDQTPAQQHTSILHHSG